MEKKDINKDVNGKESSKRFWARRFFTLGFWIFIILIVFWAVTLVMGVTFEFPKELLEMWVWMMGFASAVLVGTVLERPKQNIPPRRRGHKHRDEQCEREYDEDYSPFDNID